LFEEGQRERHGRRLHVTLNRLGHLFFNARALAELGQPECVALLFDPKLQVIGVMAVPSYSIGNDHPDDKNPLIGRRDARAPVGGELNRLIGRRDACAPVGGEPNAKLWKSAYELRKKNGFGSARLVYAKNFCNNYGIKPRETVAFRSASVNKDGVLMLDLQKVVAVTRDK
jgi:hypothetical protein